MDQDNVASPARHSSIYPPLPPTEDRSRAPEFYGFVSWTSTYVLFCLLLLWALLPDKNILWLGVSWYPNREWALLLPAYSVMIVLLTYFTYFALAIAGTPNLSDARTITDSRAHLPGPADGPSNPYVEHALSDAIPTMYDIPIGLVNRVVYGGAPRKTR